jgi:hypothetical protein
VRYSCSFEKVRSREGSTAGVGSSKTCVSGVDKTGAASGGPSDMIAGNTKKERRSYRERRIIWAKQKPSVVCAPGAQRFHHRPRKVAGGGQPSITILSHLPPRPQLHRLHIRHGSQQRPLSLGVRPPPAPPHLANPLTCSDNRALNDFGGAFCMGAIGGSLWHGIKGFRNSPYVKSDSQPSHTTGHIPLTLYPTAMEREG